MSLCLKLSTTAWFAIAEGMETMYMPKRGPYEWVAAFNYKKWWGRTPTGITKIKKIDNTKCWRGGRGTGTLLHGWWECKMAQSLWKLVSFKLKYALAVWPCPSTSGSSQMRNEKWKHRFIQKLHSNFVACRRVSCWERTQMPSWWVEKACFPQLMEYPRHYKRTNYGSGNNVNESQKHRGKKARHKESMLYGNIDMKFWNRQN